MKRIAQLLSLVVLLAGFASFADAQTALTSTTTTSAIGLGPSSLASGTQANLATTISLTSATGVQPAFLGTQPVTFVYVDQELFGVISLVPGQTTIYNVLRAQQGTKAGYHRSGALALIGTMSPQFGGVAGSGGFQTADPPLNSVCTAGSTGLTPWINVITGEQWLCSTVTNTWVPGWNNRFVPIQSQVTTAVASASTIVPTGPLFHLTGTTAVVTVTLPLGFERGQFTVICDGACTWTAGGNIAVASNGTTPPAAGSTFTFVYDVNTGKFYPSHTGI